MSDVKPPVITKEDAKAFVSQRKAVFELMRDGRYRTLRSIALALGVVSEAGVSARLRDLRKARWGSHTVVRRRVGDTRSYEYCLLPNVLFVLTKPGFSL